MKKFIFILGGARSGKSRYAVSLAKSIGKKVAFIATADASDEEMKKRIEAHKRSRPADWQVIEEAKDIVRVFVSLDKKIEVAIIDCAGLFISNLLMDNLSDAEIEKKINSLEKTISESGIVTILVSNDVGSGIVPDNPLARRFRDLIGNFNQAMAKSADEVVFMCAGIPAQIK